MSQKQSIIPIIRDADRGRLLSDMQDGVDKIVGAIEAARGSGVGEIVLRLKIKSTSEGVYSIAPDLKIKVPEVKRQDMLTFLDEASGELMRRDPRQPDIPGVVQIDAERNADSN